MIRAGGLISEDGRDISQSTPVSRPRFLYSCLLLDTVPGGRPWVVPLTVRLGLKGVTYCPHSPPRIFLGFSVIVFSKVGSTTSNKNSSLGLNSP